jgi:hypothetical protein
VLIKNYPKKLSLEELERQLNEYRQGIDSMKNESYKKITVEKINLVTPFYLDESKFNNEEIERINK